MNISEIKTEQIDECDVPIEVVPSNRISETQLLNQSVYVHVVRLFSEFDGKPKRLQIHSKLSKEGRGTRKEMDITLTRTLRSSTKARPAQKSIGIKNGEEHFSAKAIKIEPCDNHHDLRMEETRPLAPERVSEAEPKNETPEQRDRRLAACNVAMQLRIRDETPKERKKRLRACNLSMRRRIANETDEEREQRLAAANLAMRRRIANETPEERKARLAASRRSMQRRLANETFEEREKRLTAANLAMRRRIANETVEERERRLAAAREAAKKQSRRY